MRIEIVPYSPSWPDRFTAIQLDLQAILTTNSIPFLSIEYVGSISVPNLDAKPILDIDIIITRPQLAAIILASKDAGYTHHGEWKREPKASERFVSLHRRMSGCEKPLSYEGCFEKG